MLVGELLVIGERTAAASRKVGLLWCGQSPNVSFNVLCGVPAAVKCTKLGMGFFYLVSFSDLFGCIRLYTDKHLISLIQILHIRPFVGNEY